MRGRTLTSVATTAPRPCCWRQVRAACWWPHGIFCFSRAAACAALPAALLPLTPCSRLHPRPHLPAAESGHCHCVEALLRRQADPNAADASGITPLLAALGGGFRRTADALLDAGAQPLGRAGGSGVSGRDSAFLHF